MVLCCRRFENGEHTFLDTNHTAVFLNKSCRCKRMGLRNAFRETITNLSKCVFWASCRIRTNDPEITNHVLWPTELKRRVGKQSISRRYNQVPLLRSSPGGVPREHAVQDLPVLHEVVPCLRVQRYSFILNAPNIWGDIFWKNVIFTQHIIYILQYCVTL